MTALSAMLLPTSGKALREFVFFVVLSMAWRHPGAEVEFGPGAAFQVSDRRSGGVEKDSSLSNAGSGNYQME